MGKANAGSSRFDVVAAAVLSQAVYAARIRTRPGPDEFADRTHSGAVP
jgi:hypothetical protein